MLPEDIKKQLEGLGIPVNSWTTTTVNPVSPELLEQQKQVLQKVKDLLHAQMQQDSEKIAELTEALNKQKYGGGA